MGPQTVLHQTNYGALYTHSDCASGFKEMKQIAAAQ